MQTGVLVWVVLDENTPVPYCEIRGWSESFVYGGMRMMC